MANINLDDQTQQRLKAMMRHFGYTNRSAFLRTIINDSYKLTIKHKLNSYAETKK